VQPDAYNLRIINHPGDPAMPQAPARTRRPPPALDVDDSRTLALLAERALNLITNEQILSELNVSKRKLVEFMDDPSNRTVISRHLVNLRKSGEMARWLSNAHLVDGVNTAHTISQDGDIHPSVRLKAVDILIKSATNVGDQPKRDDPRSGGPTFSLTLNLGGEKEERLVINGDINEEG
jgi:hypothetical protein